MSVYPDEEDLDVPTKHLEISHQAGEHQSETLNILNRCWECNETG